jgi:hypothetical protein
MSRPAPLVMLAGSPVGTPVLLSLFGSLIFGWYLGNAPWWMALAALGLAFRTLSAMGARRRYLAWEAEWKAMGRMESETRAVAKKRGNASRSNWLAALVWVASLAFIPAADSNDVLVSLLLALWIASSVYLLFRGIRSRARRTRIQHQKAADDAPVSWAVDRASSSPSRESAQRNLPGYSARVIGGE